jgi:hypothetical protein
MRLIYTRLRFYDFTVTQMSSLLHFVFYRLEMPAAFSLHEAGGEVWSKIVGQRGVIISDT